MHDKSEVLFIADHSVFSKIAYDCVLGFFPSARGVFWEYGNITAPSLEHWQGDWIISFKSDFVLPPHIFKKASKAAINFHPAPPKYRGLGGYSWAIHNSDKRYGVTCHHIVKKIDFGRIIAVKYFPVQGGETPASLKIRAGVYCLCLLNEILDLIAQGRELPLSKESWGNKLYTFEDLKSLLKHYHQSDKFGF
jgi:methionyl-tRNA formyltransferase